MDEIEPRERKLDAGDGLEAQCDQGNVKPIQSQVILEILRGMNELGRDAELPCERIVDDVFVRVGHARGSIWGAGMIPEPRVTICARQLVSRVSAAWRAHCFMRGLSQNSVESDFVRGLRRESQLHVDSPSGSRRGRQREERRAYVATETAAAQGEDVAVQSVVNIVSPHVCRDA